MAVSFSFEKPGTLPKPAVIGRSVRLLLGVGCLCFAWVVLIEGRPLVALTLPTHWGWWAGILIGFFVFPYVVGLGFGRHWGRWPQLVVALTVVGTALLSFVLYERLWGPPLGWFVRVWLLYVFGHLGLSFVLASIIGTPGCEMRAVPHLWMLVTGRETKEHCCPGLVDRIDGWERGKTGKP